MEKAADLGVWVRGMGSEKKLTRLRTDSSSEVSCQITHLNGLIPDHVASQYTFSFLDIKNQNKCPLQLTEA